MSVAEPPVVRSASTSWISPAAPEEDRGPTRYGAVEENSRPVSLDRRDHSRVSMVVGEGIEVGGAAAEDAKIDPNDGAACQAGLGSQSDKYGGKQQEQAQECPAVVTTAAAVLAGSELAALARPDFST